MQREMEAYLEDNNKVETIVRCEDISIPDKYQIYTNNKRTRFQQHRVNHHRYAKNKCKFRNPQQINLDES